jgi:hypothetical protein
MDPELHGEIYRDFTEVLKEKFAPMSDDRAGQIADALIGRLFASSQFEIEKSLSYKPPPEPPIKTQANK